MPNITNLEKEILGILVLQPVYLEDEKVGSWLTPDIFDGQARKVFETITLLWEEARVEPLSELELAEKSGVAVDWIGSLTLAPVINRDYFRRQVLELVKQRFAILILGKTEKLMKEHEKTGAINLKALSDLNLEMIGLESLLSPPREEELPDCFASIEPEPVTWLWPNFIPRGMVSLIAGDPGCGKTWLTLDLACRLSRGMPWPDGSQNSTIGSTVFLNLEDHPRSGLRYRIEYLGGDAKKIYGLLSEKKQKELSNLANLKAIGYLATMARKIPDLQLIVIDPIVDFSGAININRADQVRRFLNPLAALAERLNVAITITSHMNKAQEMDAIYRTLGTVSGWTGKARAVFLMFKDEDDRKRKLIYPVKTNLSPEEPPRLAFRIANHALQFEVVKDGLDFDAYLNPEKRAEAPQLSEALNMLKELFKESTTILAEDAYAHARKAGISLTTMNRAKSMMKAKSTKEGKGWRWEIAEK